MQSNSDDRDTVMDTFERKTAVVTGAASGIGLGMVEALASRGMRVVMADIEQDVLEREAQRLHKANLEVTPCVTDVSAFDSVAALLRAAMDAYGQVHVLCNNAGVAGGGGAGNGIWEASEKDWEWVMGVNVNGVIHGLRAFIPHMLAHGEPGHVVNTSSIMGLTTGGGSVYGVSKHAVARLTEGLYHDLRARDSKIGVTLLCPGLIATNIITSVRNRPEHLSDHVPDKPERAATVERMDRYWKSDGMPPRDVGELVADAINNQQFYLLTHAENMQGVQRRFDDIVNLKDPTPPRPWQIP